MLSEEKQTQFAALRRQIIAAEFGRMNPRQLEGVLTTEGPLLLLAGARERKDDGAHQPHRQPPPLWPGGRIRRKSGSYRRDRPGLSGRLRQQERPHRAGGRPRPSALRSGTGSAWQVIAITFTNKAAGELKQRLEDRIGPDAQDVWAATFHSACVRILRRDIEKHGFPSSFTI